MRMDPDELACFLLHIEDLPARNLVIMREELLGYSRNALNKKYRINNNLMTKFTDVDNQLSDKLISSSPFHLSFGGRKVVSEVDNYPAKFLAFISLLSRVPLSWLTTSKPERIWSTDHFDLLNDVLINYNKREFFNFLYGFSHNDHDVRAAVLIVGSTDSKLYLRVEQLFGTIIIELCNSFVSPFIYNKFRELFQGEEHYNGYMPTVVPNQINHSVVMKHPLSKRPLCFPVEFILKPSSLY